jgi:hypothetical protein
LPIKVATVAADRRRSAMAECRAEDAPGFAGSVSSYHQPPKTVIGMRKGLPGNYYPDLLLYGHETRAEASNRD